MQVRCERAWKERPAHRPDGPDAATQIADRVFDALMAVPETERSPVSA